MENDGRVLLTPSETRFYGVLSGRPAFSQEPRVELVRGRKKIASLRGLLVELCGATGQAGAMDTLEHLLHSPTALGKMPYLVLVGLRTGVKAEDASANDLHGAVLLYEYRVAGRGTRVFATDDVTGHRTVIAPAERRLEVAELACRALVRQGALMMLVSVESGAAGRPHRPGVAGDPKCSIATRVREVGRDLLLEDTFEATLAQLGSNTRRNFRRYRTRLERDLGAYFVPNVEIEREQFLELTRNATNPIPEAEAAWRYSALGATEGRMLAGVRGGDGRWLSLIGGRRNGSTTELEWQINRADLPRYSLSTVMRAYLLEDEVRRGMKKVVFKGGTPHSMRHSLIDSGTMDIVVVRLTPMALGLWKMARWVFPHSIYLGHALRDPELVWTAW